MHKMKDDEDYCAITLPQYVNNMGIVHEAHPHGNGRAEVHMDETFGLLTFEPLVLGGKGHQIRCQTD